jgi:hypothetical protein
LAIASDAHFLRAHLSITITTIRFSPTRFIVQILFNYSLLFISLRQPSISSFIMALYLYPSDLFRPNAKINHLRLANDKRIFGNASPPSAINVLLDLAHPPKLQPTPELSCTGTATSRLFHRVETIYLRKVYRYYDRTIAPRHMASEVLMRLFVAIPRSGNQSHLSHARAAFRLYYQNMHIFAPLDLCMNLNVLSPRH